MMRSKVGGMGFKGEAVDEMKSWYHMYHNCPHELLAG